MYNVITYVILVLFISILFLFFVHLASVRCSRHNCLVCFVSLKQLVNRYNRQVQTIAAAHVSRETGRLELQ